MKKLFEKILDNKIKDLIEKTQIYISKKGYPLSYIYKDKENPRNGRSVEELKEMVGEPISTEILYNKQNSVTPQYVKWEIAEYGRDILDKIKDVEITKIPISKIEIIQQFVFEIPLQKTITSKDFTPLFLYEGKYYLNDGNHYVASSFLQGKSTINAKIINVAS